MHCIKCKEKVKKILLWIPAPWMVSAASMALLILLLAPLIRIAFYTVPWYDGYNFGKYVKNFLDQEYSLQSALNGAIYCVRTEWYAWQGTYTATFLNAFMPAVWGEGYYFLGPLFILLILPVALFVLIGTLVKTVLKSKDTSSCVILQSVVATVAVVLIHSPREGFFWYVGGICYVGVHSFLMLLVAAWIKLLMGEKWVSSLLLLICTLAGAAVVAGSTYVTVLQGLLIGLSIIALGIFSRNKRVLLLLPSILVYTYGFYRSVIAPGNAVRKAVLEELGVGMNAVSAIWSSFLEAFRYIGEFTDIMTLIMMMLVLPVIWNMIKRIKISFRYPAILLLWSFCLYAAGFTPCLYSTGSAGPERALNVMKLTYQVLLFVNEVYWVGWFYEKLKQIESISLFGWHWDKSENPKPEKGTSILYYLAIGILVLGIGAINPDKVESYSSYGAYYYVHTGEAFNFYQEYLERVETIKNGGDVVAVKPYNYKPSMICMGELSEDPYSGQNAAIAKWYDKEAVILEIE